MSKTEPVQAAFGLTGDGEAVILLDRKARPKKVSSMLRATAAKAKLPLDNATVRYGRAEVDTEYDPGMIRFFVNKEAPGAMRAKLVELAKRIPYQKVEINVDPSLEAEPEDGAPDGASDGAAGADGTTEALGTPPPPPPPPEAAPVPDAAALARELAGLARQIPTLPDTFTGKPALVKLATDANVNLKTNNLRTAASLVARLAEEIAAARGGPAPAEAAPGADPAAHRSELGMLARRIAAVTDPARKAALAAAAAEANAAIKSGDHAAAAAAMDRLRADMAPDAMAPDAQEGGPDPKVAFAQARLRYETGRKQVRSEIEALMSAMRDFFKDEPDFGAIDGAINEFAKLRDLLDDKLLDELDRGYSAASVADAAAARTAAVGVIGEYQAFLAGNAKLVAGLDGNPFVPVTVGAVLPPLLADLANQLR